MNYMANVHPSFLSLELCRGLKLLLLDDLAVRISNLLIKNTA